MKDAIKKYQKYFSFLVPMIQGIRNYDDDVAETFAYLTWINLANKYREKNIEDLFFNKGKVNFGEVSDYLEYKEKKCRETEIINKVTRKTFNETSLAEIKLYY